MKCAGMNLTVRLQKFLDGFLPLLAHRDEDTLRHCRLIIGFGFLGGAFGLIYATFYWSIAHYYGSAIIAVCDAGFIAVPWMLRNARKSFAFHGHVLCVILTFGFCCMAMISA